MKKKYKVYSAVIFALIAVLFTALVFIPSLKKVYTDFPNYYVSSNMLLDGKDLKTAYDNVEFNRQLLLYGIEGQIVSFMPYPPVTAILFLPVAKLEPLTAKLIWNLLNALLLMLSIYVLSRLVSFDFSTTGIMFFFSGYALVNNFLFGQAYILVLFCLILSIYFMIDGKDVLSALFMALSIVLKFYTVFFLFLFIFKKRFKLLYYTIAFGTILYIPVIIITGVDLNMFYYSKLMLRFSDGWVGTAYAIEYQSFVSLLHRFFDYEAALNPAPLIQSMVLFYAFKYLYICGVLCVSFSYLKNTNENIKLEISLFCIISMMFLPVNASYQFIVLIPAVIFLCEYYFKQSNYVKVGFLLFLMFIINSHGEVRLVNALKDTPFFIFGYVKLFALIYLWLLNLKLLGLRTGLKPFNPRMRKFMLIGGIHVVGLTILSSSINQPIKDGAVPVLTSKNYMISNPSVLNTANDKLIYTECINEKFVLNSNFGLKYDKESVFSPVFINQDEIAYETVIDRKPVKKILNIKTGTASVTNNMSFQNGIISNNGNMKCFIQDGQLFIQDLKSDNITQLTSGRQINSYPRFAENDTKIIFCSDRSRGAGFTTLYQFDLNKLPTGK